ncbi:MAG: 4Fe-4S dicluster domain-containing protein [Spirochaetes bacterium]|nr:4Fe-4S dicluster domain-containing protein [Spirochaetota bacterium]
MSHLTSRSAYEKLVDRLNKFPQGAPPSELLYKILSILYTTEEAELVSIIPIKPFTVKHIAKIWKKSERESQKILDQLADKGLLVDIEQQGTQFYVLPPPMAGFIEFTMMRVSKKYFDQKILAELYYQYLTVEEDFIKALFTNGETQLGRVFVQEKALSPEKSLHVLDYERASEVIKTAKYKAVGTCYCRHKMEHMGKACSAPMDICMTFGGTAHSLIKHGIARPMDEKEGMDLLNQAIDHNLVQFGENTQQHVAFICHCCGCCCEAMIAARRFGFLNPINTSHYLPNIQEKNCNGCGKCVNICPVEALSLVSANDPQQPQLRKARLNKETCLGCGVCVRNCPNKCLELARRDERIITPVNSVHKVVMMAIERGVLQNLIFDNQALWNHRAMAAILGVILKLPPVKQIMASEQIKSRYLGYLLGRKEFTHK